MQTSKKSAVPLVKVYKPLSGESNKINNDLSVKNVVNYSLQTTHLFQTQIKKYGSKNG
jgi:hypothetical protein